MNINGASLSSKRKDMHTSIKTKTVKVPGPIPRSTVGRSEFCKPKPELKTPVSAQRSYKLHNCQGFPSETPVSSKTSIPILKRKSVSLVELPVEDPSRSTPFTCTKRFCKESGDESKLPNLTEGIRNNISTFRSFEESVLAKKVLLRFTTNAWRRQRSQVKVLETFNRELKNQVENRNLQTIVLKDLLAFENERAQTETNVSALLRIELENEGKTNEKLKSDLKLFEGEKDKLENTIIQKEEENKQLQEKLDEAEKLNLDTRNLLLVYYREQEDSKAKQAELSKKLKTTEEPLEKSRSELVHMKQICDEYQTEIEKLSAKNQENLEEIKCKRKQLEECTHTMKRFEAELAIVKTVCKEQNSCIERLRNDYEDALTQISEKNRRIEEIVEVVEKYETAKEAFDNKCKSVAVDVLRFTLKLIPLPNYLPF